MQETEKTARIHYSTKQGTRRLSVRDIGDELAQAIKEIEKSGGIVLRVSRAD